MHTIGVTRDGDVDTIVDDERDAVFIARRLHRLGAFDQGPRRGILIAHLHNRHSRLERLSKLIHGQRLTADEIKFQTSRIEPLSTRRRAGVKRQMIQRPVSRAVSRTRSNRLRDVPLRSMHRRRNVIPLRQRRRDRARERAPGPVGVPRIYSRARERRRPPRVRLVQIIHRHLRVILDVPTLK